MNSSPPIVCIIDDDFSVRKSIVSLIRCFGLEARAFESAEAFLDADAIAEASFLIVDVRLPGISGIELLERLTESGWTGPAAVVTGNADTSQFATTKIHDGVHYLTKPCEPGQLMRIISAELADHDLDLSH